MSGHVCPECGSNNIFMRHFEAPMPDGTTKTLWAACCKNCNKNGDLRHNPAEALLAFVNKKQVISPALNEAIGDAIKVLREVVGYMVEGAQANPADMSNIAARLNSAFINLNAQREALHVC